MKSTGFIIAAVLMLIPDSVCYAAVSPAIVQTTNQYTLGTVFEHPRQIAIRLGREERPRLFWYTIITLTNRTGKDVDFFPTCELMTDTFQIIPAGKNTPYLVFGKIKQRHISRYPLLESVEFIEHRILQGSDHTKDIAVIWPDFDPRAKNIKLFISGLSNETAVLNHPKDKDKDGQSVKIYLRKTLELSYSLPGDPAKRAQGQLMFKGKRWIMR